MQIEWIDSTCLLLKDSQGKRILMDPINFLPIKNKYDINPNIITFSNPYTKYSCPDTCEKAIILNTACSFQENSITVEGFNSFKDNVFGLKRGPNIIYKILLDNISICNLGNIGHIPNDSIISKLKYIDLLFLPIGGNFFLNGEVARNLTNIINPKYVIPFGFSTYNSNSMVVGASNFLKYYKEVFVTKSYKIHSSDLPITKSTLPILLNQKYV